MSLLRFRESYLISLPGTDTASLTLTATYGSKVSPVGQSGSHCRSFTLMKPTGCEEETDAWDEVGGGIVMATTNQPAYLQQVKPL